MNSSFEKGYKEALKVVCTPYLKNLDVFEDIYLAYFNDEEIEYYLDLNHLEVDLNNFKQKIITLSEDNITSVIAYLKSLINFDDVFINDVVVNNVHYIIKLNAYLKTHQLPSLYCYDDVADGKICYLKLSDCIITSIEEYHTLAKLKCAIDGCKKYQII